MLERLFSMRCLLVYLKFIGLVLAAIFCFSFLFPESLNANEQKCEKAGVGGAPGLGVELKLSKAPNAIQRLQQQQQHQTAAQRLSSTTPSSVAAPTERDALTLNAVYEYSEKIYTATKRDLVQRRQHLNEVCQRYNLQAVIPVLPWEFFISPGHQLVWCNVFKAASSTWLYYFNILGGYDITYLQLTEEKPLKLARKRFPRPDLNELLENLPSSVSFIFVREPFERLVSGYRNKLEGGRNNYYKVLGNKIIRQVRKGSVAALSRGRSGPTFKEFLQFLIQQYAVRNRFDEHWAPVYSFCTPCSVNFTIIGKVETFQRDTEFIIRQSGLEPLLLGKLPKNNLRKIRNQSSGIKTETIVERYFADIDRATLDQLIEIYRLDFELFDYNFSKYYGIVEPPATRTIKHTGMENYTITKTTALAAA